jgi:hypothetical protein
MRTKVILLDENKTYIGSFPTYVDAYFEMKKLDINKIYYQVYSNGDVRQLHHDHIITEENFNKLHEYTLTTYIDVEDNNGECYCMFKFYCRSEEDLHKIKNICYSSDIYKLEDEGVDFVYFS